MPIGTKSGTNGTLIITSCPWALVTMACMIFGRRTANHVGIGSSQHKTRAPNGHRSMWHDTGHLDVVAMIRYQMEDVEVIVEVVVATGGI